MATTSFVANADAITRAGVADRDLHAPGTLSS